MADVYTHQQQHHTISPTVLSSSRPTTPGTSSSLAGPSSQPALAFDPEAYIDLANLHNPTSFDPAALGFVPQQHAGPSDLGAINGGGGGGMPFATGSMGMTRTGSSSSGGGSTGGPRTRARTGALPIAQNGGSFVSFDPDDGDGALDQDDASDDDERAVEGRPRKRKSVRDLRGAASNQSAAVQAQAHPAQKDDGGAGGDEDKTRRKISIEYIEEKSKRHITFSKRKAGIMKKAYELSTLTGTQVLLLVVSESGWVYTFTTDKFKPLVKEDENGQLSAGQKLIAACLEAKDGQPDLSAAYQSAASSTGNFEANSAVHGGQISLKTGARARPLASNRRVSSRGRANVPTAIQTNGAGPMDPSLPCPPGSGGIPPLPQLPTPMSSNYLDPMSPRGPHSGGAGPRSLSHPPISPARGGTYSLQQQQQQAHAQQQQNDYAEMMQRADLLHLQQQQHQQHQHQQHHGQQQNGGGGGYGHYDEMYGPASSHHNMYLQDLPLPPPPPHLQQQHANGGPRSHALHHQASHDGLPQPPPQTLHHARSFSHGGGVGGGAAQHGLRHQASHGHLGGGGGGGGGSGEYGSGVGGSDHYGGGGGGGGGSGAGGNYTHAPPGQGSMSAAALDPRRGSNASGGQGWQTPQGQVSSAQGTPMSAQGQGGQALYAGGDDGYGR
ncbi:hypothetical protein JCM3775_002069 [Rhodotorula graminis]